MIYLYSLGSLKTFFNHSIVPDETSNLTRYSFTFRSLAPYNLNFTKIIGDSNTKELVFGPDRGRLGRWMPGSLIKAAKIANIPDAFTIGPCRNIVIHVGINDVKLLIQSPLHSSPSYWMTRLNLYYQCTLK